MALTQKDFSFDIKVLSENSDDGVSFEGFASTFGNVDLVNDIVDKGAFKKSLKRRMPKMLLQHDFKQPIGVFTDIKEVDNGLFVKGKLLKGIQAADETSILLRNGVIDSMSIGYNVIDSERVDGGMLLKELDLHEISLVTFPANPMATITQVKGVVPFKDLPVLKTNGEPDTTRSWDSSLAIKNIKTKTGSEDAPTSSYRNAFLYFDNDGSKFSDYKLPIADVVKGTITAIPRGIFAAASAVSGARSDMNISEATKATIVSVINKYYSKMGMDSPFNKSGGLLISSHQAKLISNKREFEKCLRDSGCFSKSAATILAANWSMQGDPVVDEKQVDLLGEQMKELNSLLDSVINN